MNGEANVIMDEPMDTSPSPDTGTKTTLRSEPIECETLNNCSNSNGTNELHSDDGQHSSDEDNGSIEHEVINHQIISNTTVPLTVNNDKIPQENHCSDSNESYPESVDRLAGADGPEAPEEPDQEPSEPTHSMVPIDTENNVLSDSEENDESEEEVESESQLHEHDDSQDQLNDSDIILIENSPLKQNGNKPIEIQLSSSDNDDDEGSVAETDDKNIKETENIKATDQKLPLRRSTRCLIKDLLKNKEEHVANKNNSNLEVASINETISKNKPIVISDTKKLFDMAAQHRPNLKSDHTQLVIIDSNSRKVTKGNNKTTMNAVTAQNLYQSIAARGTTVTPVPARVPAAHAAHGAHASHAAPAAPAQPSILPSLTDDMFVVEAPSFIVPYVYEKPSKEPFREFVDILGKQLEEEKAKEQKILLEKKKHEKEKKKQERKERKEQGEDVLESQSDSEVSAGEKQQKLLDKAEKRARRQRGLEAADDSWDAESSCDSEDIPSDEDVPELKQKHNNLAKLEGVVSNIADKAGSAKADNYFECSLGKLFMDVGSSLVQEYVQADLLKQQARKLHREKRAGHSTRETQTAIASLSKNLQFSKENNAPFKFTQQKCEFCSFKTESSLVMSHHLETPHMKSNMYHCNFCSVAVRSSHEILLHAERAHAARGRLERAPGAHACPSCPFEDNGKGKLARHLVSCAKRFRPELNLAPPIDWEPPAKLPKMVKMKNNFPTNFKGANMGMNMNRQMMNMGLPNHMKARPRAPLPPQARPGFPGVPIARGPGVVRHNLPTPVLISNYTGLQAQNKPAAGKSQPSISITALPRAPPPQAAQQQHQAKGSFVICEICDGYIKDLEQLRNHMQWIHKVKIHPKMIYNRPPLNCQKCQFRFFTDQGLERHLLGSHGLVTSSMQEAANKGKDAGRCPVCGRVYQWKLLNHVARDHNMTLKPAHLSYKCTVCTATFGMYKLFENHVYSAHRVVAKRVMDKNKIVPPAPKPSDSLLKPLKINDEITIIPQPAKPVATTSKGK